MPDDLELKKALMYAKCDKAFFGFVARGTAEGKLLVSKKTPPKKLVAEAKKELGSGGKAYQGVCFGEDSTLVFEMEHQPPSYLANQLKRVIREEAGMSLKVETRAADALYLRELEATEEEGSEN